MKKEIKVLENYVNQITYDSQNAQIDTNELSENLRPLGEELGELGGYIKQMYEAVDRVADGDLEHLPSSDNPYAGVLKQHVSNLKHLTWQARRIAQGDYEQRVDFMGEFADSFNIMIEQLKNREQLTRENEKMQHMLYEQKQEALKDELENQIAYFEKIEASRQELRGFRHDISNHILTIKSLINKGDYDGVNEYVDSVYKITERPYDIVSSGNFVLDALLAQKEEKAKLKDIDYNVEMVVSGKIEMDNMDICIMFGNAVDNAIEACERSNSSNKTISMKFVKRGNVFNAVIKNTADEKPKEHEHGAFYETSKDNEMLHGIGMRNMAGVAEKYNGFLKSSWEDGQFTLTIFLSGV